MNDHDAFEELLALRLYGELDAGEHARLDQHLTGCGPCRELARELESGLGRLLQQQEHAALSPAVRAGLGASMASERRAGRRPVRAALLGFAAGVVCALSLAIGLRAGEGGPKSEHVVLLPAAVFARATPPPQALDRGLGELLSIAARR